MTSRDEIFAAIRANRPRLERALPAVPAFDDHPPASLLAAFKESLERMGGLFLELPASGERLAPVRDASMAGRPYRRFHRRLSCSPHHRINR
jgi:L-lactate dehydrogenase complex protein LldG